MDEVLTKNQFQEHQNWWSVGRSSGGLECNIYEKFKLQAILFLPRIVISFDSGFFLDNFFFGTIFDSVLKNGGITCVLNGKF